ncbi:MAG: helix-turn-helix domain-containing protein [Chitinophagaceae bacterium]|nr:helix-turn-helix domain-containing protein [Chitinophagaceae bacterium]
MRTKLTFEDARKRELLRISEVADLLGESRANVYLRIKSGQVKAVHFGKTKRVHAPSLFSMIDQLENAR